MRIATVLVAALLAASPAFAADAKKVDRMIEVLQIRQAMDQMREVMTTNIKKNLREECTRAGTADELCEKAIGERMTAMDKILDEGLSWDAIRPELAAIYARTLTDEEVDSAVAYYSSPAGKSLLTKLPALMKAGSELGQQRVAAIMPRLQAEAQAAAKQIDAASTNPPPPPAPPAQH